MALKQSEIVREALRLLDEEGLDALSMRRLAERLHVKAGALYWHFADKQALVDAMIDHMLAEMLARPLRGGWQAQTTAYMQRLRGALTSRRDAARLMMMSLRPGEHTLMASEVGLRILREGAGMSKATAMWASSVLSYYVIGFVIDTQVGKEAVDRGAMEAYKAQKRALDPKKYPHLLSYSDAAIGEMITLRNAEARFAFGLKVILRGLVASVATRSKRRV